MNAVPLPVVQIRAAAANPDFVTAVRAVFEACDQAVARHLPICINRGSCCRFDAHGHRLYVTAVELAYFLAHLDRALEAPPDRSFCPYQVGGRCTARQARPAGCRIYFCDPAAQAWQPELTEATLAELARVGELFGIPYAYVEWTESLRELGGRITPPDGRFVELNPPRNGV